MPNIAYNGADWRESPNTNGVRYFFYENGDMENLNLPSRFCFVMVMNYSGNRGAALAIDWRGDQKAVWANRKHDAWGSWYRLQIVT